MKKRMLLFICLYSSSLIAGMPPEGTSGFEKKPLVSNQHAMIVTNNKWATLAAKKMLNQGGNAIDAAIAAAFVLGLTEPQSSGIGGGGYALTYNGKSKALLAYDGRETAPHSALPDMNIEIPTPQSIAVPGAVALLYQLHHDLGVLPWPILLAPAIELADHGFPMSPRLYRLLSSDATILKSSAEVRAVYFNGMTIKPIGSLVVNKAYANTLREISMSPESFYHGKLADNIIRAINTAAHQALYNKDDLAHYRVVTHPALCSDYRHTYTICSVPPSSSGGVTVQALLGIYSKNYNGHDVNNAEWMYQFLEASKLAFADRNQYLADPAFVKQPLPGLLDQDYLTERSHLVKPMALQTPVAPGTPKGIAQEYAPDAEEKQPGTTSLVIIDSFNNAISMTLTVESQFGSHLFTNGFFLNNEMTDFSGQSHDSSGKLIANRIQPGKRPRSSMSPTIVFDQQKHIYLITGSPGGSEIICYVAKNLIQILDMKMKPNDASASPNLCATNSDPVIEQYWKPIPQLSLLEKKGEIIVRKDMTSGVTTILRQNTIGWLGAADPRREGVALG